jgi:hypothetical protein
MDDMQDIETNYEMHLHHKHSEIYKSVTFAWITVPAIGGPRKEAIPWKSNSNPNAFVRRSRPSRSTRITEVNPTYAPMVNPYTDA